jgi:hypothetical protein
MLPTEPKLRAGSSETYASTWEWNLRGTNREIGRALATYARDRLEVSPLRGADAVSLGAQRRFFEAHFHPFHQRMIGVADAFGLRDDDLAHDLSSLPFDVH